MPSQIEHVSHFPQLVRALWFLASQQVMVGVPAEEALRKPEPGEKGNINNAFLAYIHEHGSPEANVPPRPFLRPAIEEMRPEIVTRLLKIGRAALKGDVDAVTKGYHMLGLRAQNKVRAKINEGVPPPLADSTLRARARRGRKGAAVELQRRAGLAQPVSPAALMAGMDNAKPLIDTGQLRNSITYVIRKVSTPAGIKFNP
jgi:hypothetical protein